MKKQRNFNQHIRTSIGPILLLLFHRLRVCIICVKAKRNGKETDENKNNCVIYDGFEFNKDIVVALFSKVNQSNDIDNNM